MSQQRDQALRALREQTFDLLVVGAGMTGAGAALEAAARGLRVAVVDKGDIASGTSSWSTKLVHGGVRYLEQLDFAMVHEGLQERYILTRIAPHLVHRLPFLYPIRGGAFERLIANSGLWLYDILAGRRQIGLHRTVSPAVARAIAPLRAPWDRGGFSYNDAQTDDVRLALTILLTALERGAIAATYTEVTGFLKENGRVRGAHVRDTIGGEAFTIRARAIVNATGVWLEQVQHLDDSSVALSLMPSKGTHVVVPSERLSLRSAVIMPETSDGRVLFAVPWQGRVLLGTTDAPYDGDLDCPVAASDEVAFILAHANEYFKADLRPADIIATYAGLRPLMTAGGGNGSTKDISRKHVIVTSPSGLVSIGGGKLTTYRVMGRDAVDAAVRASGLRAPRRAQTDRLLLTGAAGYRELWRDAPQLSRHYGVSVPMVRHLLNRFGSHAPAILELIAAHPDLGAPLVPDAPYLAAEAVYSARHELVMTLEDVLARRMRLLLLDPDHGVRAAPHVAALLAPELGWDARRIDAEVEGYRRYARRVASGYSRDGTGHNGYRERASLPDGSLDIDERHQAVSG